MAKEKNATNRSRTPHSKEFLKFIAADWDESTSKESIRWPVADYAQARRDRLAKAFEGKVMVIEAGHPKVRANDTEYRYRPDTAFTYLTGWGAQTVPGSILVIDARKKKTKTTLYLLPTAGKESDEFFANPAIGEFWVGSRPTLEEIETALGIPTADIKKFPKHSADFGKTLTAKNKKFSVYLSEMRFVKDEFEIAEMRKAVAASVLGFQDVAKSFAQAKLVARGERVVEGAFFARARVEGNDLGYETIAAAGSNGCILHWTRNDGPVKDGELILVDAGVEVESLYTADITRTLPINGSYSPEQRFVYQAVLEAADAAFRVAKPGVKFRDIHNAAMEVISRKVAELGLIPVSAEDALKPENQHHRRYMVHGTSHHLGIDVHDCAQARREMYQDGVLEEGMIFTIEPGLYLHPNDLRVPEAYRGIAVRIEDDVLVTKDGVENLSAGLPRDPDAIEAWLKTLL